MAVVVPDLHKVQLHESKDLKAWKLLSEFGPLGDTTKIWECPDLFDVLMIEDPSQRKWGDDRFQQSPARRTLRWYAVFCW